MRFSPSRKSTSAIAVTGLLTLARVAAVPALLALPVALTAPHAFAQSEDPDEAEAEQEAMEAQKKKEARKAAKRAAPPSALPGAEGSDEEEDTGHARVDVNPTTALFDAINRGSINSAREALNRGADLNAHNVLDQTPLDMAIDLNRNDIMFLLLSMRVYNPDGKLETEVKDTGLDTKGGSGHLTIGGSATKTIAKAQAAPKFDTRGTTSDPAAGFLGFGGK